METCLELKGFRVALRPSSSEVRNHMGFRVFFFEGLAFRVLGLKSCITLRALSYGNYGIFLIMGYAGFTSSTVVLLCFMAQSGRSGPPRFADRSRV